MISQECNAGVTPLRTTGGRRRTENYWRESTVSATRAGDAITAENDAQAVETIQSKTL